jgi:hypothetical protein
MKHHQAFFITISIACFPSFAFSGETCIGGMMQKAPQPVHNEGDPSCPPAGCSFVCVAIPASAAKTGETISVYPHPHGLFNYELGETGVSDGTQQFCYTLKNWSDTDERSYSVCVQYREE